MTSDRVLIALSGGVDSSVAALLLQQQGYDVTGVFLRHGAKTPSAKSRLKQGCCSSEDALDAAKVADQLKIPFHVIDMEDEFAAIQSYFREAYAQGHTPNPCAVCNRDIKFGALLRFADGMKAPFLATGHYAQLQEDAEGVRLFRGMDVQKDQSYVLFPVPEEILKRTVLPVGGLMKSETRELAREAGFPVFDKPDSQEICFVPTGDYRDVLHASGGLGTKGNMIDLQGKVLASHAGHMGFTRGQRRGLGFASTQPMYVLDINAKTGDILVGPKASTQTAEVLTQDFHWFGSDGPPRETMPTVEAQYRSAPGGVRASAAFLPNGEVRVSFLDPTESVNPGQGIALYQGNRLLGAGWIAESVLRMPSAV